MYSTATVAAPIFPVTILKAENSEHRYHREQCRRMGHSSSAILDMYFTMNDRYAQTAMNSLSFNSGKVENRTVLG